MNYIVKNCPSYCYLGEECHNEEGRYGASCCEITDCVLKQIVELCKYVKLTYGKLDKPLTATQCTALFSRMTLADEILKLLDIQEITDERE